LGAGLLINLLAMTGIFLVELALGAIRVVGLQLDGAALNAALGEIFVGAALEEFLYRSLLLSGLVVALGGRKWSAILISAALFGLSHYLNPGASYISAFGNALGGIIYGVAFLGGRNLWLPLGLHFMWNFAQGPIFGFPVSGFNFGGLFVQEVVGSDLLTGGAYGPEAGLVGIVFRFVILAMVLYYLQLRSRGQGDARTLNFALNPYVEPHRAA
jgi:membrane protease YdiL (CAAX protease family)